MRAILFASFLLIFAPTSFAQCADEYYRGAPPAPARPAALDLHALCFDDFAVGHSGVTHTPLWSAEHLTSGEIDEAHALPRRDAFHAEAQLPFGERAELVDYRGSGYDRGHMAPSGDMPTRRAQMQSFTLANMVPQAAALNRGLWEEIEIAVRDLADSEGELYVVTGPIFDNDGLTLNGRVRVPRALFKALYDPERRQAGAYVADNSGEGRYRVVSIAQLRAMIGFDVFPSLTEAIKNSAMDLPAPQRRERRAPPETASHNREPAAHRIFTAY